MKFRIYLPLVLVLSLILVLAIAATVAAKVDDDGGIAASGLQLWQQGEAEAGVWTAMRPPARHAVENWLLQNGKISIETGQVEKDAAVTAWYKNFLKRNQVGPDPVAKRKLLQREKALIRGDIVAAEDQLPTPKKDPLFVVVEFGGTNTMTVPWPDESDPNAACVDTEFTWGPSYLGEIPAPGPKDNFTFWLENPTIAAYESVVYGIGPDAPGYGIINHPNLGPIDLTGLTANNFILEMSHGTSQIGGSFLQETVVVDNSHEYYGHEIYQTGGDGACFLYDDDANTRQLPYDVVDKMIETYGDTLDCSQWDADGDQIIDGLVLVHAGEGNESGCGNCIWSHSSNFHPWEDPPQLCGTNTPEDPSDDYFIGGYNQDPEPFDLGVIVEEYEHQWGLPDLYVVDASNSNSWWGAPHTSGVYGGPLGGTRPVGHNLWQDYMLGWRDPLVIDYDDPELEIVLGRNRDKPEGTEDGLIIRLPDQHLFIDNMAGEGVGWYSTSGDGMANTVTRDFDLSAASGATVFSFDAYWDIEEDWDYGYLRASTDGGDTWMTLPDMDGVLTDYNPHGSNLGWGLTGYGDGNLRFDLSAYNGGVVSVQFAYFTDVAVANPGWWVDNLLLVDDSGTLYENDLETDFSDWTVVDWIVVPYTRIDEQYYLVEWWDDNGMFNVSLNDPYYTYWSDEAAHEWAVTHQPFNTPGMVVSYRNVGQDFDYEISSDLDAAPSTGPKYGLLVVDSHYSPMRFDTHFDSFQDGLVGYTMYGRTKSGNASYSLHDTNEKSALLGYDVDAGMYVDPPIEEKIWPPEPGIPAFHDSMAAQPGFYYPGFGGTVYYSDWDSSLALPAKDVYSTKITDPDGAPLEWLYGIGIGPGGLGTGNPGDAAVQYGVHVAILEESEEQATIRFWNSLAEVEGGVIQTPSADPLMYGDTVDVEVMGTNIGFALDAVVLMPLDDSVAYIAGSEWGGAMPLTAMEAMQMAEAVGYELPAFSVAEHHGGDPVVAVAWEDRLGTGEMMDFGFTVEVATYDGTIHHSAALFDGTYFIQPLDGDTLDIYDDGMRMVELPLMADTWVNGGDTAANFDMYAASVVRTTGLDNALLTFDRTDLPEGVEIVSAELMINTTLESGSFGKELTVLNTAAFDSTMVTYDDAPVVYNPGDAVPLTIGMMTFDVAGNVAAWDAMGAQATADSHLGQLAISGTGPWGRVVFDSLETYQAVPPMLKVIYMVD